MEVYDYIIVGGGSSGCVVAAKLSENPKNKVLVIEAGEPDHDRWIHIPATFFKVIEKGRDIIVYESEPEAALNHRKALVPQGYVLGGGSSVNAMIYIRGQAADYDHWAELGNQGWAYADVLPTFRELEHNARIKDAYHGNQGPLWVSDPIYRHPLSQAFVSAAEQAGLKANSDFNGATQEGMGFYQTTTHNGKRCSAAVAFLHPVMNRPNLRVLTQRRCAKITFTGLKADGVTLEDGTSFRAQGEVILCAGALETPRLLQLSGIGAAAELKALGITPIADNPGVGENYQDHYETPVQAEVTIPSFLNQDKGLKAAGHMLRYLLGHKGLLTSNVVASGGFATVMEDRPDTQFHVLPVAVGFIDRAPELVDGITLNPCWLRPRSRGSLKLRSKNPRDKALFHAGMLSDEYDMEGQIRGVELALRILQSPALAQITRRMILPKEITADRSALAEHIRNSSKTVFHPSGTCKMGHLSDPQAVVDHELKVRGVKHLRVADVSIMPTLVSGNTNAPAMMIGARCAKFILNEQK